MATFAVTLVRGPSWDESTPIREQRGWAGHAAFMDQLVDDGFLVLGGPVGDRRQTLHLVEADTEQHVLDRFANDPWAHDGLLVVGSVQPWALWLDSRSPRPGP